jgi:hypothetical protein
MERLRAGRPASIDGGDVGFGDRSGAAGGGLGGAAAVPGGDHCRLLFSLEASFGSRVLAGF